MLDRVGLKDRADHLPAYGYRRVETPSLDALAKDSILFDNALSHVPLTLPSHVSLFTGLLPFQHGVRDNLGYRLSKEHATLATLLRKRSSASGAGRCGWWVCCLICVVAWLAVQC